MWNTLKITKQTNDGTSLPLGVFRKLHAMSGYIFCWFFKNLGFTEDYSLSFLKRNGRWINIGHWVSELGFLGGGDRNMFEGGSLWRSARAAHFPTLSSLRRLESLVFQFFSRRGYSVPNKMAEARSRKIQRKPSSKVRRIQRQKEWEKEQQQMNELEERCTTVMPFSSWISCHFGVVWFGRTWWKPPRILYFPAFSDRHVLDKQVLRFPNFASHFAR